MEPKEIEKLEFISVLPDDRLGGAEYIMYNISRSLYEDKRLKGLVFFLKKSMTGAWKGVSPNEKFLFGKNTKLSIALIPVAFTIKKISSGKINCVISSQTHVNGYLGLLRKFGFLKTKYLIVRESNTVFDRLTGISLWIVQMLHKFGYPNADLIICQTQYMKDTFLKRVKVAKNWNVQVIPNPLPLEETIDKSTRDIEENWEQLGDYLVGAGRLIDLKGFDLLIKVFSQLENKKLNLVILGKGNKLDSLKAIANEHGVSKRVIFKGLVPNPMPYFKNAKLCVVSSRNEGFPNVLLQMMALNNNVISTRCAGGIDDLPGITVCDSHSESELLKGIQVALKVENSEKNRILIDEDLKKRSVESFIDRIFSFLPEK